MKTCCNCKKVKPLSEFYKDTRRLDGYRSDCKDCHNIVRQHYVSTNHEVVKSYFRNRYESDIEYRERQKGNSRANYTPDYQINRYRNDPEYRKRNLAYSRKREALRKGASTAELIDRQAIIERDNATCYICGKGPLDSSEIHLDHVISLNKGGFHTSDNLRVACMICNCKKQDKDLDEVWRLIEAGLW